MPMPVTNPRFRIVPAALAVGIALLAAGCGNEPSHLRQVKGLVTPESVVVGPDGRLFVSEIGEFDKDGDGRITAIDATSGAATPFASGLNDPKGLGVWKDSLYVTDKNRVMKIDAAGKSSVFADTAAFPAPPIFLNDLVVDADGTVYVSDSGSDAKAGSGAIYRIAPDGAVTLLVSAAQNPAFKSPNGLLFERPGQLLVVDFSTGDLLRLDIATLRADKIAGGFGGGDGLALDAAGRLFITDWKGGGAWKLDLRQPGATPEPYKEKFKAAADIALSADGAFVLVPDMKAGLLYWLPK